MHSNHAICTNKTAKCAMHKLVIYGWNKSLVGLNSLHHTFFSTDLKCTQSYSTMVLMFT